MKNLIVLVFCFSLFLTFSIATGRYNYMIDPTRTMEKVDNNLSVQIDPKFSYSLDFLIELLRDNGKYVECEYFSGSNSAIGTSTEALWEGSSAYNWLTSATTIEVSSSSAYDATGEIGIRTIRVTGLDENYNIRTEDFIMEGTTEVASSYDDWIRITKIEALTAGTYETNYGDIYVGYGTVSAGVPSDSTKIYAKMLAGKSITNMAVNTVPDGYYYILIRPSFNSVVITTSEVTILPEIQIYEKDYTEAIWKIKSPIFYNPKNFSPNEIFIFDSKSDFYVGGKSASGTFKGNFSGYILKIDKTWIK